MKTQQQQKAREMYFQTNMSKSDIATQIGVDRRTLYQWSVDGDWEKLRASARSMPAMLAEKCYYLIGHFTDHLLSRDSFYQSVTKADADILFKLTKTVALLKKGSTVSENMETFTCFLESLQAKDPALADALIPHMDAYITARTAASTISPLDGFTPQGFKPFPEREIMEKWQDEKDAEAILEQRRNTTPHAEPQNFAAPHPTGKTQTASNNENPPHVETQNFASPQPNDKTQITINNENPPHVETQNFASLQPTDKTQKVSTYKAAFWKNQDKARQRKQARKNRKAA